MKKKITALFLVAVLALTAIGGTLAYFTDTDAQTNTFTAGKVGIKLDEAIVTVDEETDNLVATNERTEENQEYILHPGIVVAKDPTITVDADSLDAYVASVVTIKGELYDLIGIDGYDTINVHALASGGLLANDGGAYTTWNGLFGYMTEECFIHQVADKANNTWTMYIFMNETQAAETEIVLFDTLTIPAEYDNAEMAKINGMTIEVNAYAAQQEGFVDCFDAMTNAFDAAFTF